MRLILATYFVLVVFAGIEHPIPARAHETDWIDQFGTTGDEFFTDVAVHGSAVYVVGLTNPYAGTSSTGYDAVVRKYSTEGSLLWEHVFGATAGDTRGDGAHSVVVDDSGVYVGGQTMGTLASTSTEGDDIFVRKYLHDGTHAWTQQFGTATQDRMAGLVAYNGDIYVGGTAGDLTAATTGRGLFVRKFDTNGNIQWTHQALLTSFVAEAHAIAVDESGIYLGGDRVVDHGGERDIDAFVHKYTFDGTLVWADLFGTSPSTYTYSGDRVYGIAVHAGSVYATGYTDGPLVGTDPAEGGADVFIRKYDINGTVQWTDQPRGWGAEHGIAIDAGSTGIYIAAQGGGYTYVEGEPARASVLKYDTEGALLWIESLEPDRAVGSFAHSMAVDENTIYLAGTTHYDLEGPGSFAGLFDAFVAKLTNTPPSGTITSPADGSLYALTDGSASVSVTSSFTDPDTDETHTCSIDWGDGAGFVAASGGLACGGTHAYTAPGVYTITVRVTDHDGAVGSASVLVVVYDPNGGFATGGGWIESPSGAYTPDDPADTDHAGTAVFGFVARYSADGSSINGNSHFRFPAADFVMESTGYDWLMVSGTTAQFQGSCTINGSATDERGYPCKFRVWADDNAPDTIRVRVWTQDSSGAMYPIYDNGTNQPVSGGAIVVHSR